MISMAKPTPITVPTEPIGSIPRPVDLIERVAKGDSEDPDLAPLYEDAIRDTIERFEATGSSVVTDGEQRKYHNFATYCVHGLPNTAPDGFKISFSGGHTRRMARLTRGPFRYRRYADCYLDVAMRYAHVPVKQAVISPSALSLMYPAERIRDYSREQFIDDLLSEHKTEIRRCLKKGAHTVQGRIGNLAARHGAMSVQSPLTTTTAESHDVPFAACLALRCRRQFPAILFMPAGRCGRLSKEDSCGSHP